MLLSLALMFLCAIFMGFCFKKIHFPPLFGMIIAGVILNAGGFIDESILNISSQLRQMALIIILLRAGLSLNAVDLKRVGRPAFMMCFVPACFEILGMAILAPPILGVSVTEALIIGSVTAAVSPAVIVPFMLKIMEEKYGTKKSIPQLILAGAAVDDVFVIVMFYAFISAAQGQGFSAAGIISVPFSIIMGIAVGTAVGMMLSVFWGHFVQDDTVKLIIILCAAFLLNWAEDTLSDIIPFSGLIGIMSMGMTVHIRKFQVSKTLSEGFNRLWTGAQILLFVLVGAAVNLSYAVKAGISAIILILCVLLFRMAGVFICVLKTRLNFKERLFCMLAYIPKATVQAAMGGIPLAMGLDCGNIVLTVSVVAILITAPLGAFLIDFTYKSLLENNGECK